MEMGIDDYSRRRGSCRGRGRSARPPPPARPDATADSPGCSSPSALERSGRQARTCARDRCAALCSSARATSPHAVGQPCSRCVRHSSCSQPSARSPPRARSAGRPPRPAHPAGGERHREGAHELSRLDLHTGIDTVSRADTVAWNKSRLSSRRLSLSRSSTPHMARRAWWRSGRTECGATGTPAAEH